MRTTLQRNEQYLSSPNKAGIVRYLPIVMVFAIAGMLVSCEETNKSKETSAMFHDLSKNDSTNGTFDLSDIKQNGELIAVTLTGPDTYFELRGEKFGMMYELANKFAQSEGVRLRIELANDTTEMLDMLRKGEVDLIAYEMPVGQNAQLLYCGSNENDTINGQIVERAWAVRSKANQLAKALDDWYKPALRKQTGYTTTGKKEQGYRHRKEKPVIESSEKNIISPYDDLFKKYANKAGWDWRLIASIAWQESGFDPKAESWAGAQGLMQIMPATARGLDVDSDAIWDPETNIATGCRVLQNLQNSFRDIDDPTERINFILASYNVGEGHVRDAMALTKANGGNSNVWEEVVENLKKLSEKSTYTRPEVKHGYANGNEPANYVEAIMARWGGYNESQRNFDLNTKPKPAKAHIKNGKYQSQVIAPKGFR